MKEYLIFDIILIRSNIDIEDIIPRKKATEYLIP